MGFKEQFEKMPPGPAREEFIYKSIINQGPPKQLVPITVNGPNGTKITYKVMPDYLMIEGIRVPLTGATAQRVANHFGMSLPTTKMDKQIWQAADTKLKPTPMSGGAYIGGKYYSGQEVVNSKINTSDTSVAFNEKINKQLQESKNPSLVAGHMKSIVQPDDPNRLGLTGWYMPDGTPIQKGNISSHDTTQHSEYAGGTRLVSDNVIVTNPDGSTYTTTMDKLLADKTLGNAITLSPGGSKKYTTPDKKIDKPDTYKDKSPIKKEDRTIQVQNPEKQNSPSGSGFKSTIDNVFKKVDDFISQLGLSSSDKYINQRIKIWQKY